MNMRIKSELWSWCQPSGRSKKRVVKSIHLVRRLGTSWYGHLCSVQPLRTGLEEATTLPNRGEIINVNMRRVNHLFVVEEAGSDVLAVKVKLMVGRVEITTLSREQDQRVKRSVL